MNHKKKNPILSQRGQSQRMYTIHLYEISKTGNYQDRKQINGSGPGREKKWGVTTNRYGAFGGVVVVVIIV